jgi:hypothetical protein
MMEKKVKLGLFFGFLSGIVITAGGVAWYNYPKHKIDSAMQDCNVQFGLSPDGIVSEEMLSKILAKYPSQQAMEAAYTSCVNESLK